MQGKATIETRPKCEASNNEVTGLMDELRPTGM